MKRSEFVAKLNETEDPWVTSVVELAEAAGVKWEPEEEPLPEKLTTHAIGRGCFRVMANCEGGVMVRELSHREAREAVRRWDAFSKAKTLVKEMLGVYGLGGEDYARLKKLEAVLDEGGEGGS